MSKYSCTKVASVDIIFDKTETSLFSRIPFMGLKDKNARLIYFGDILRDDLGNLLTPVCEVLNGEHVLFFKPIQHLNKKIAIGCKSTYSDTLEIIDRFI